MADLKQARPAWYSTMAQVRSRPDSSGHIAQPFTEARVVDANRADTRRAGSASRCSGEGVTKGDRHNPEATQQVIRDGWLHTGDLMAVYPDGAMRLVDRLKDVIITGGRKVYSC